VSLLTTAATTAQHQAEVQLRVLLLLQTEPPMQLPWAWELQRKSTRVVAVGAREQ